MTQALTNSTENQWTYKAFLSHNSKNKSWVRTFCAQLEELGIPVFFDEKDIVAGDMFPEKIEQGLNASQHIVLVLTPCALESDWVALERCAAMVTDPANRRKRIIPVLLEAVDDAKYPALLKPIQRADLTDPVRRNENFRQLLRALGAIKSPLPDAPPWNPNHSRQIARPNIRIVIANGRLSDLDPRQLAVLADILDRAIVEFGKAEIVAVKEGSVIIDVRVPEKAVGRVLSFIEAGGLDGFGVSEAHRLDHTGAVIAKVAVHYEMREGIEFAYAARCGRKISEIRVESSESGGMKRRVVATELSAELEAEINAAMEDLAKFAPPSAPSTRPASSGRPAGIRGPRVVQAGREHRSGRVVSIGPSDIFIEFGPKELGVVSRIGWPEDQLPKVGETAEVVVDRFEASESLFICSRPGAVQKADWELLEAGQTIEARVTGVNKGGLELEVAGHRAFMPASQVSVDRIPDMSVLVGEKMTCQVVRVDRMGKGNIVLSRRDLLEQERKAKAEKLKATLVEGAVMEGVVRKIMPFGAFVDLGGMDGLVHISDMTYDRAGFGEKAVAKYVKEGQPVRVQVLKVDIEGNKISLGMKQVAGDPFATAANDIKEGSDVTGRVVRITEFGAFVELAPGVDGMVHISELDYKRVGKVEDVLKVDQVINARVLRIDAGSRRISLSIKATKPAPEPTGGEGGGGFGGGGPGGGRGKKRGEPVGRSADEILKETPALRRMREKFKKTQYKGGLG